MKQEINPKDTSRAHAFHIYSIPALLIGAKCKKIFLFVHGLHGYKEEGETCRNKGQRAGELGKLPFLYTQAFPSNIGIFIEIYLQIRIFCEL